jgi:hypothetical protein
MKERCCWKIQPNESRFKQEEAISKLLPNLGASFLRFWPISLKFSEILSDPLSEFD